MRKLSTRIGVYAMLLIAALYGTLSVSGQLEKTAPCAAAIMQKVTSSTLTREQTAAQSPQKGKEINRSGGYFVSLQTKTGADVNAGAQQNFFTHSATIQHYISTI